MAVHATTRKFIGLFFIKAHVFNGVSEAPPCYVRETHMKKPPRRVVGVVVRLLGDFFVVRVA